jgi:hypothetical protein
MIKPYYTMHGAVCLLLAHREVLLKNFPPQMRRCGAPSAGVVLTRG